MAVKDKVKIVKDILENGSAVPEKKGRPTKGRKKILSLYIDDSLIDELDNYTKTRAGIYRNGVILEAIHEKLRNVKNNHS